MLNMPAWCRAITLSYLDSRTVIDRFVRKLVQLNRRSHEALFSNIAGCRLCVSVDAVLLHKVISAQGAGSGDSG